MKNAKSGKVRIIVVFGDIEGFTEFCEAITNDAIEYDPLMEKYDAIVERAERETGYRFDEPGDGFMVTVDIPNKNASPIAAKVVKDLFLLMKNIQWQIDREKNFSPPAPAGFRMVGAAGFAKRKIRSDGRIIDRGKHINKAHNYLPKVRGKGFVCLTSLKDLINKEDAEKYGLTFEKIGNEIWAVRVDNIA